MLQTNRKQGQEDNQCLPVGYKLDQYEIEALLRKGDLRIKYYAWDHANDRNVVIHEYFPNGLAKRKRDLTLSAISKKHNPDFEYGLSEFLIESRVITQIESSYLPHVIEYREANGTGYLVSEYDDGELLYAILENKPLNIHHQLLKSIFETGLRGLSALHSKQMIHLSVNPANIFIRTLGHPILLGYGLAKYKLLQHSKKYAISLPAPYTAIEQYSIDSHIGPWTDLYALGATLYECIAGVAPIDARIRKEEINSQDIDPLTPAVILGKGDYPMALLSNIDWMLKVDIDDRPQSADLLLGMLKFHNKDERFSNYPNMITVNNDQVNSEALEKSANSDNENLKSISETNSHNDNDIVRTHSKKSFNIYIPLAFMFAAFVGLSGYQIYQHESKVVSLQTHQQNQLDNEVKLEEDKVVETPDKPVTNDVTTDVSKANITRQSDENRREFYENLNKQEEVERLANEKLQAQLEAVKKEQKRIEESERKQQNSRIKQYLNLAKKAMKKNNFMKPADKSAFDYYQKALSLDEKNKTAKKGLDKLASVYSVLINEAIRDKNPELAKDLLKDLIKIKPDNSKVDAYFKQITDITVDQQLQIQSNQTENAKSLETQNNDRKENAINKDITNQSIGERNNTSNSQIKTTPSSKSSEKISSGRINRAFLEYDSGNYSTTNLAIIINAANNNNGHAQYILAEVYAAGRGVEKNIAESRFWLERSLDHVNQQAASSKSWAEKAMGVIYEKGWYVDSNPQRAIRWYQSSANKNYAPAQYRLGLAYAKGLGVDKDLEKATFWFNRALENGNSEARKALSKLSVPSTQN